MLIFLIDRHQKHLTHVCASCKRKRIAANTKNIVFIHQTTVDAVLTCLHFQFKCLDNNAKKKNLFYAKSFDVVFRRTEQMQITYQLTIVAHFLFHNNNFFLFVSVALIQFIILHAIST